LSKKTEKILSKNKTLIETLIIETLATYSSSLYERLYAITRATFVLFYIHPDDIFLKTCALSWCQQRLSHKSKGEIFLNIVCKQLGERSTLCALL